MKLPDLEAWAVFACVNQHRSFTAAAAALGTSKGTVSKTISRLEEHLGAALFHRTSRQLTLTQAGIALAPRAAAILAEANAAEEAARNEATAPTGLVRIAAPMSYGQMHLGPAIAEFVALHPGVTIDIQLADEKVDIVAGGFDFAIRIGDLPDSSLRARRVGDVYAYLLAAPSYLEKHGRPKHPADLANHIVFAFSILPNGGALPFTGPGGERATVRPIGSIVSNSPEMFLPAMRAGLGIAPLPDFLVADDIRSGALEALLPEWLGPPIGLYILSPPSDPRPRRVTLLIDFLADYLRKTCAVTSTPRLAG